jgi:hypothetical protein
MNGTMIFLKIKNCCAFYGITPWSRVLLVKLKVPQLVKNFPAFYGTWNFTTVCLPPVLC